METARDVSLFFKELTDRYALNFHPDTPFEDFDVLTPAEARRLNKKMERSFEICERENVDIYKIGFAVLKSRISKKAHYERSL